MKTFRKLKINCSTDVVSEFSSEFSKQVLGKLGFFGKRQYRAICGQSGPYNIFLCRVAEDTYELFIEGDRVFSKDQGRMEKLERDFRRAYIEVAVVGVVEKLNRGNMPSELVIEEDYYLIKFGASLEYQLVISFAQGKITEEVTGIKGDFCTRLTEDIETLLSKPSTPLITEWKPEFTIPLEDKNIQVLSLNF